MLKRKANYHTIDRSPSFEVEEEAGNMFWLWVTSSRSSCTHREIFSFLMPLVIACAWLCLFLDNTPISDMGGGTLELRLHSRSIYHVLGLYLLNR